MPQAGCRYYRHARRSLACSSSLTPWTPAPRAGSLEPEHTCRTGTASAFHAVSAQLLRFVKCSVGPGEGLDDGLARPVLCHSD
jgi:hypothetical protein